MPTIKKLVVKNYKLLRNAIIDVNPEINIFVGDNDSGKSTILEVISILTSGKLNGVPLDRQIKANLFNNESRFEYINEIKLGHTPCPPEITLEAYFDGDPKHIGTQNSQSENTAGIRIVIYLPSENTDIYLTMLNNTEIKDIPVELYTTSYHYFNGDDVYFRNSPFTSIFIDTRKKAYTNIVDHFISDSVANNLSRQEIMELSTVYRRSRENFRSSNSVKKLNSNVKSNPMIQGKKVTLDLIEDEVEGWKYQMSIVIDDIPFENIGLGTQNAIKIELALKNASTQADVVIMEEPENNLAFMNMARLVNRVLRSTGKQVFISTHSSYIANKLDLGNVLLVNKGNVVHFSSLSADTKKYFIKIPGYDTLRFVLADKTIMVEGPTDDLIVQRAYRDVNGHLPFDDGIDVFVVNSLAFLRFCEIAKLIHKNVVIVTDNDGSIQENIEEKYSEYYKKPGFTFYFESDENLRTIELSVLQANCVNGQPSVSFTKAISSRSSMINADYSRILNFMLQNKAEWAYRVFESDEIINYPEYIQDVIKHF